MGGTAKHAPTWLFVPTLAVLRAFDVFGWFRRAELCVYHLSLPLVFTTCLYYPNVFGLFRCAELCVQASVDTSMASFDASMWALDVFLLCREVWLFRAGECQRQRALTSGNEVWGGVLEGREGLVLL